MAAVLPCWNCYHKASRISYVYWDHVTLLYLGYHDEYYMVMTLSYFCNGNRCTGKVASLHINIHIDEIRQSCYLISMDWMCFLIRWHNSYAKYGYTIAQPYLLFANRLQIAECHTLFCPGFVCLTYVYAAFNYVSFAFVRWNQWPQKCLWYSKFDIIFDFRIKLAHFYSYCSFVS